MRLIETAPHHYINKPKSKPMKSNRVNLGKRLVWMLMIIPGAAVVNCSDGGMGASINENDINVSALTAGCSFTKAQAETIQFFPSTYALNQPVDTAPVDSRSNAIMSFILTTTGVSKLHNDFAAALFQGATVGIPYIVTGNCQSPVPVVFRANSTDGNFGDESDPGPYPIPLTAPIEGGGKGDAHVLAVDIDNHLLYEMYNASIYKKTNWGASQGSKFDLNQLPNRPIGWTSADAAGLAIVPFMCRYDEVASGVIDHALRFTLPKSVLMKGFTAPASHLVTGSNTNPNTPVPLGMRLRLKANFDISGFAPSTQVILTAMKKYGIVLADIGSAFFITGAPDTRWTDSEIEQLKTVNASNFEVVQIGAITTVNP
jgi:hypothetical protein